MITSHENNKGTLIYDQYEYKYKYLILVNLK